MMMMMMRMMICMWHCVLLFCCSHSFLLITSCGMAKHATPLANCMLAIVQNQAGDAGGGDVKASYCPRPKVYSLLYVMAFAFA